MRPKMAQLASFWAEFQCPIKSTSQKTQLNQGVNVLAMFAIFSKLFAVNARREGANHSPRKIS